MKLLFCSLALFAGGMSADAETATRWSGVGDIAFSGTSTLHDWTGKVAAQPFSAIVTFNETGQPVRVQSSVVVEAAKMDTAEAKRDDNMRKAMRATAHPLIRASIDAPFDKIMLGGKAPVRLPLTLTLLGKPQQVEARISNWKLQGKQATFDLDFEVSMKGSGISVPPVLIFIRVGDAVKVRAAVTLTQF